MEFSLDLSTLITILITIVISLSIHEAMHAFVGLKLGDTTAQDAGRVSFNPLKHIDPITTVLLPIITLIIFRVPILAAKPVPFDPRRVKYNEFGPALIALAGPVTNLGLAIIGAILAHSVTSLSAYNALVIFSEINVGLFVFNMIPIPPLDGSRVLYAFAPEPIQQFMMQLEQYGLFLIFGLVLIVPGFSTFLIAINRSVLRLLGI